MFGSQEISQKRSHFRQQIRRKNFENERKIFLDKVQQIKNPPNEIDDFYQLSETEKNKRIQILKELQTIYLLQTNTMNIKDVLNKLESYRSKRDLFIKQKITTILIKISLTRINNLEQEELHRFMNLVSLPQNFLLWIRLSKFSIPQIKVKAANFFVNKFSQLQNIQAISQSTLIEVVKNFLTEIPHIPPEQKLNFIPMISFVIGENEMNEDMLNQIIDIERSLFCEDSLFKSISFIKNNYFNILRCPLLQYQNSNIWMKKRILSIFVVIFRDSCIQECIYLSQKISNFLIPFLIKDLQIQDNSYENEKIYKKIMQVLKFMFKGGDESLKIIFNLVGDQFLHKLYEKVYIYPELATEFSSLLLSISLHCSSNLINSATFLYSFMVVLEEIIEKNISIMEISFCLDSLIIIISQRLDEENDKKIFKQGVNSTKIVEKVKTLYYQSNHSEIKQKAQVILSLYDE